MTDDEYLDQVIVWRVRDRATATVFLVIGPCQWAAAYWTLFDLIAKGDLARWSLAAE